MNMTLTTTLEPETILTEDDATELVESMCEWMGLPPVCIGFDAADAEYEGLYWMPTRKGAPSVISICGAVKIGTVLHELAHHVVYAENPERNNPFEKRLSHGAAFAGACWAVTQALLEKDYILVHGFAGRCRGYSTVARKWWQDHQ